MASEKKKIKVAFVLGALNRGGMESLILDICRRADECPFEVVCIYRKEGNFSEEFHKTQARMIHIPKTGNIIGYMYKLRRMILAEKIDIVHSQTPSNTMVLGLSLIGCRKKIVTTIHGFSFLKNNALYKRFVYGVSKRVLFVSNYQMNMYTSEYKIQAKSQVIYNGIDYTKYELKYTLPDIYQLSNQMLKLCVIGNIREARTYEVIIEAVNLLKNDGIDIFDLFIIGDSSTEEQIRLQNYKSLCKQYEIEHMVHFVGSRGDIPAILQYSDIYIMSSIETFGISIVEAMMTGVPVIVNDFEVMKEITENGKFAILYSTGNAEDLSNKIKQVANSIESYKEIAKNRTKEVKNKYSIENHINNLYKIYTDL